MDDTEFTRKVKECGIPMLRLVDGRGVRPANLRSLICYLKEHQISILHTHSYKADLHGVILKPFLKSRVALITTHHGWITNTLFQKAFVKLDLFLSTYFDGVITVSEQLSRKLPRRIKEGKRCIVIHNGLVLEDYATEGLREDIRKTCGLAADDIVVGMVGRLSKEKGPIEMIEAFNLVRRDIKAAKLLIVGDGPMTGQIKDRIQALGLREEIVLVGHSNRVQPFYEAMDMLVSPSFTEGLSNVILEAFAYKLPVIATNVGGNSEIIDSGVNGLLVSNNSAYVLGGALRRLLLDRKTRLKFGELGYKTVRSRFDFRDRVTKEESFYESLMKEKSLYGI